MAHGDTTDSGGTIPHVTGDLFDWDSDVAPVNGSTPVYSGADTEHKNVPPAAAITDTVAITGGEAPTEAEFNALQTKFNTLLAACRVKGIIAP